MDTQEEREAFDVWYYEQQTEIGYDALWSAWQAAKAKAIPDGFVVVPKESTEKMNKAGLQEYRKVIGVGQDDIGYIYKAMIEAAQEKEVV